MFYWQDLTVVEYLPGWNQKRYMPSFVESAWVPSPRRSAARPGPPAACSPTPRCARQSVWAERVHGTYPSVLACEAAYTGVCVNPHLPPAIYTQLSTTRAEQPDSQCV